MGNDYGGRRSDNPEGAPRVSAEQVRAAAQQAGVEVKRESVVSGSRRGWCMWWAKAPGDVWRTLETTNYKALYSLQRRLGQAPIKGAKLF